MPCLPCSLCLPCIQPVDIPFLQFFTPSTMTAYKGITSLDELAASQDPNAAAPASSGVSSGAAAGIGIGCTIAGALIAAVVMTLLGKKKKGSDWQRQADAAIVNGAPGSASYKL